MAKKFIDMKTFSLGKFFIGFSFPSKKKSMWITRTNKHKSRMDHFFSIHRTYNREKKLYIYGLILYKLNIKLLVRG